MPPLSPAASPLLAAVCDAVRQVLTDPGLELTMGTSLQDIRGWDSMDLISVIVELECRFDVMFELREIDGLYSVGDLVRALAEKSLLAAA